MSVLFATLLLAAFFAHALASADLILPSGARLPVRYLTRLLGPVQPPDLHRHVYEQHTPLELRSSARVVDLSILPRPTALPPVTTDHWVDGRLLPPFQPAISIATAAGFIAVYHGHSPAHRTLVLLAGNGLSLAPIHPDHPQVFIDLSVHHPSNPLHPPFPGVAALRNTSVARMGGQFRNNNCESGTPHYLEIAVAFDSSLCNLFDNDAHKTVSVLHGLFAAAQIPFLRSCVRFAISHVEGNCDMRNDPYIGIRGLTGPPLGDTVMNIWNSPQRKRVHRDMVFVVTGFTDGTPSRGFSIPGGWGGVCNRTKSYAWLETVNPAMLVRLLTQSLFPRVPGDGVLNRSRAFNLNEPLRLSDQVVRHIAMFVDSPEAWCISSRKPDGVAVIKNAPPLPKDVSRLGSCTTDVRRGRVATCTSEMVVGTLKTKGGIKVVVSMWQVRGKIHARFSSRHASTRVKQFAYRLSTNGSLRTSSPQFTLEKSIEQVGELPLLLFKDLQDLEWPSGKQTCCGFPVALHVEARMCGRARGTWSCGQAFGRFFLKLRCGMPCRGIRKGTTKPMSERMDCPKCER